MHFKFHAQKAFILGHQTVSVAIEQMTMLWSSFKQLWFHWILGKPEFPLIRKAKTDGYKIQPSTF